MNVELEEARANNKTSDIRPPLDDFTADERTFQNLDELEPIDDHKYTDDEFTNQQISIIIRLGEAENKSEYWTAISELSTKTKLSIVTLRVVLGEMVQNGLVIQNNDKFRLGPEGFKSYVEVTKSLEV